MSTSKQRQQQQQHYFQVEDTSDLCYRDIIAALERRHWLPASSSSSSAERHKKKSKFEKKLAISRHPPEFLWTISEKSIDFDKLLPSQRVNHFRGVSSLTTKSGVCDILREMLWINQDPREVSPR
jgi:hypothetical protein